MADSPGPIRSFVDRGGLWVLAQIPLLVLAYLVPDRFGRVLPLEQLDIIGGLGFLLLAAGVLQFSVGAYSLGAALTPLPRPRPGIVLRTTGVYALVRHPIYSGILLVAIGWSLYQHSIAGLVFDAGLLFFFDRKAAREERWLMERFPDYAAYRQRVRKLIPWIY
jgi:protein-S-isoprenylcysteine O-methyltransferase Ste14